MIGAIAGDVIGSRFEFNNVKSTAFDLFTPDATFTDDTVLTVAVADWILGDDDSPAALVGKLKEYTRRHPNRGYGGTYRRWAFSDDDAPYNSWGNGSAMRASPVGFAFDDMDTVLAVARTTAAVTHDHREGIKGAQATAASIFLARTGASKAEIAAFVERTFGYKLDRCIDAIRPTYRFDVSCQGSVPEAIIAFLESRDFEHAIRLAVSLGGDSDTIACVTGGIAQAFYKGVPGDIRAGTMARLAPDLATVTLAFCDEHGC